MIPALFSSLPMWWMGPEKISLAGKAHWSSKSVEMFIGMCSTNATRRKKFITVLSFYRDVDFRNFRKRFRWVASCFTRHLGESY